MAGVLGALALVATPATTCPPAPALSYAPADVGWSTLILSALALAAGIACIGVLGGTLRWSADDRAPLRPLWMALIMLGFAASAAGFYLANANRVHDRAVDAWIIRVAHAPHECMVATGMSPSLTASTTPLSIQLGAAALALIALGVAGAVIERRRGAKVRD
jgi:hypothetical protein